MNRVGGDPHPSRTDITNAYACGVPGVVISRDRIYSYGPERQQGVNNPKGYPGPVTPGTWVNLERRPPPPWVVRNQWPEGTGGAMLKVLMVDEVITDDRESGEEVVMFWAWLEVAQAFRNVSQAQAWAYIPYRDGGQNNNKQ